MKEEVALPRDQEGREVSLETDTLFDVNGRELRITSYSYRHTVFGHCSQWKAFSPDVREDEGMLPVSALYLTPPDSWEKLFEDLDRALREDGYTPCLYYNIGGYNCLLCRAGSGEKCAKQMIRNIASRILKLRGEDE